MTDEKASEVLGDVRAYLASRASLENEMLASHTFTDICNAIKALEQEPCEDCISREAVLGGKVIHQFCDGVEIINSYAVPVKYIEQLPSIQPTPKFTDEEIQKMQELEQAQLEKAYELGMQTSFEDWLNSFNTDSATECFTAVQELKKQMKKI